MPPPVNYSLIEAGDQNLPGWLNGITYGDSPIGVTIASPGETEGFVVGKQSADVVAICGFIWDGVGTSLEVRGFVVMGDAVAADIMASLIAIAQGQGIAYVFLHCRNDLGRPAENMQPYWEGHGFSLRERYDSGWVIMERSI